MSAKAIPDAYVLDTSSSWEEDGVEYFNLRPVHWVKGRLTYVGSTALVRDVDEQDFVLPDVARVIGALEDSSLLAIPGSMSLDGIPTIPWMDVPMDGVPGGWRRWQTIDRGEDPTPQREDPTPQRWEGALRWDPAILVSRAAPGSDQGRAVARAERLRGLIEAVRHSNDNGEALIEVVKSAVESRHWGVSLEAIAAFRFSRDTAWYFPAAVYYLLSERASWPAIEVGPVLAWPGVLATIPRRHNYWTSEALGWLGAFLLSKKRPQEAVAAWRTATDHRKIDEVLGTLVERIDEEREGRSRTALRTLAAIIEDPVIRTRTLAKLERKDW